MYSIISAGRLVKSTHNISEQMFVELGFQVPFSSTRACLSSILFQKNKYNQNGSTHAARNAHLCSFWHFGNLQHLQFSAFASRSFRYIFPLFCVLLFGRKHTRNKWLEGQKCSSGKGEARERCQKLRAGVANPAENCFAIGEPKIDSPCYFHFYFFLFVYPFKGYYSHRHYRHINRNRKII